MASSRTTDARRVVQAYLQKEAVDPGIISPGTPGANNWGFPGKNEPVGKPSEGVSGRNIPEDFEFDGEKAKPLAKCLWSTAVSLGHTLRAYSIFTKLKSSGLSPDGMFGGSGYVQKIPDIRRQFTNCVEALSAISDTLHDEINAPHWQRAIEEELPEQEQEVVEELVEQSEDIAKNPEGWAAEEEEEHIEEMKTASRRVVARLLRGNR